MLLTVCTIAQLPYALTLGHSFRHHHPARPFVIGLADDPANLPTHWQSPYPLLTLADAGLSAADVSALSARYTPTEFRAACKPAFIRAAYGQSDGRCLLYADPYSFVYQPLDELFAQLSHHSLLLNPHWLTPPDDTLEPDEKYLQNVGLYSGGLIGFGPHPETGRMLNWWVARCRDHAAIDFCAGSCLDQLWLMHVPTLFGGVGILKNPALQAALWNLPQRPLTPAPTGWQVTHDNVPAPLLTADFTGLIRANEGLFQHQTRLRIRHRPDVRQLLTAYKTACAQTRFPAPLPAYGQQPEPVVRVGWRRNAVKTLHRLSGWISRVPVPPVHR